MREVTFTPEFVCSRQMKITVDDNNVITNIEVIGGCNGNLQGIRALAIGQKASDVASKLEGIVCRGSRNGQTSCPDQLAKALKTL